MNAAVAEVSTSTRHGMATLAQTSAFAGDATGGVRELLLCGLCRMLFRPCRGAGIVATYDCVIACCWLPGLLALLLCWYIALPGIVIVCISVCLCAIMYFVILLSFFVTL